MGANLFKKIVNPIRFKTTMLNAKSRLEMEQAGGFVEKLSTIDLAEPAANDIPTLIERLGALREKGILSQEEFERLFRHGFEVADITLFCYYPDTFAHINYTKSRWNQA